MAAANRRQYEKSDIVFAQEWGAGTVSGMKVTFSPRKHTGSVDGKRGVVARSGLMPPEGTISRSSFQRGFDLPAKTARQSFSSKQRCLAKGYKIGLDDSGGLHCKNSLWIVFIISLAKAATIRQFACKPSLIGQDAACNTHQ